MIQHRSRLEPSIPRDVHASNAGVFAAVPGGHEGRRAQASHGRSRLPLQWVSYF